MSSQLQPIDLTSATIGQVFTRNYPQYVKVAANDNTIGATLALYNESGCGLNINFTASGNAHYLPAGGWGKFALNFNDSSLTATVTYLLPNPPVSSLNIVYYAPGEVIPDNFTLGNSPIGIGGSVNTTSIQTLSNEINAVKTLVIDIGLSGSTLLYQLFSDGSCVWSVINGGVAHTVFTASATGNPLQLGKTGDTSEVIGSLLVDQNSTISGNEQVNGTFTATGAAQTGAFVSTSTITSNSDVIGNGTLHKFGTITDSADNSYIAVTAGATTRIASGAGGQVVLQIPGGSTQFAVNATDVISQLQFTAPKYFLSGGSGQYNGQLGSWSRISAGTYAGSTVAHTVNHGLGAVPTNVIACGGTSGGTTTTGNDTYGATTFTALEAFATTMRFRAERA